MTDDDLVAIVRFLRRRRIPFSPHFSCVVVNGAFVRTLAEARAAVKEFIR